MNVNKRVSTAQLCHSKNSVVASYKVSTKKQVSPAVLLEADLDKLCAVHEWKTFGWKPAHFTQNRATISLCK